MSEDNSTKKASAETLPTIVILKYTRSEAYKRAQKKYRKKNAEVLRKNQKIYYEKNKQKVRGRQKEAYQKKKLAKQLLKEKQKKAELETIKGKIREVSNMSDSEEEIKKLYNSLKTLYKA